MKTYDKVFTDQVKTFDLKARKYQFVEEAPNDIIDQVISILEAIIFE
ncbi:hypothetical protein [Salicibibacter kimchii]|nr:hypothetical protein [Salicibibacter kimchii]